MKKRSPLLTAVLCVLVFLGTSVGTVVGISSILSRDDRAQDVRMQTAPAVTDAAPTTAAITASAAATDAPTAAPTDQPTDPPTDPPTNPPTDPEILHFIVNIDSGCVHSDPHCNAAESISPENRREIDIPADELTGYRGTYWACGRCCTYTERDALPKT